MNKSLIFLLLFSLNLFANSSILIINSYHKGYEFSDSIVKGIEEKLYDHNNIDINILYMDSKRVSSKEYFDSLKKLYKVQLKNRKYDLIIAIDRFAYDFVLESYDSFFKNEPILALALETFSLKKAEKYKVSQKVSALLEKRDLEGNLRLLEKLIPQIKKLYIINDKSINAKHTEPLIKNLIKNFHGKYELIYLQENDLDSLNKRLSLKEENAAALFIRFYKNSNGSLYGNNIISNVIKHSQIPVFVTDSIFINKGATGGKIIDLNSFGKEASLMALEMLNKKKHEIKTFKDFTYVFDSQKLEEFILPVNVIKQDYSLVNKRLTFYDKNRVLSNILLSISPFLLLLILGLAHNIYKRRKVEKALKDRLEFDAILLNAINSALFWQNDKLKIVDANAEFCVMLNLKKEEIIGFSLEDFNNNENTDNLIKLLKQCSVSKNGNLEYKYKDEQNSIKVFLVKQTKYKQKESKQKGVVTLFTDITYERNIEKNRQKNKQFIIQQSKLAEIGEVFSSIAHQWKSPLVEITAIAQEQFYAKKLKDENEDDSFVSDIMTQVNYMTKTINDFQTFIMPSNTKIEFNIQEAIEDILKIINHNIKYNNIKISIDIRKDTSLLIYGYKNEFMQSFLNIIINAKDELVKNDYKNRKINIEVFNENKYLVIRILDNAGGIDKACIDKIFKPYYSTKKEGHGIGLYMSKMIIEDKMNGKLTVRNKNDGAEFKIEVGQKR